MDKEWIPAFGKMTYGIYVLTTRSGEAVNGMIASWVSQVSYEPPLIMAAVHPHRYSHQLIEKSGVFALHIINRSQKDWLKRFKGPDPVRKFSGLAWENGKTGAPILKDCMAWFEMEVRDHRPAGNHTLFIGEVIGCGLNSAGAPLSTLNYDGMYIGKN